MSAAIHIPATEEITPDPAEIAMDYLEAVETGEIPEILDELVQEHLTPYETALIHVARDLRPA